MRTHRGDEPPHWSPSSRGGPELLTVRAHETTPSVRVVRLCGQLNHDTAPELDRVVTRQVAARPRLLVLDLVEPFWLRPDGVPALVRCAFEADRAGITLSLVGAEGTEAARRLDAAGWAEMFRFHCSVGDAIKAAG
ncbi:STAS domain-containing protein [Amycolatopsis minnesotensis]